MTDSSSDDALLLRSAADPDAFGVFYQRHAAAVLAYLRYRTGDVDTAADLTAEVFLEAFAGRERYAPRDTPARAWLFGIANNRLAMSRRKQRRARAAFARLAGEGPGYDDLELGLAETRLSAELQRDVTAALVGDLPAPERKAVLARVVEEKSYSEIADSQGCTEVAARKRVSRGLARLGIALRRS